MSKVQLGVNTACSTDKQGQSHLTPELFEKGWRRRQSVHSPVEKNFFRGIATSDGLALGKEAVFELDTGCASHYRRPYGFQAIGHFLCNLWIY
jgi:hypothetical protein